MDGFRDRALPSVTDTHRQNLTMRTRQFIPLLIPLMFAACESENINEVATSSARVPGDIDGAVRRYGAPLKVGEGRGRSYVVVNPRDRNTPLEIGVALDAAALQGLPMPVPHAAGTAAAGDEHAHLGATELLLPLPANHGTQYKLIELNWNPAGHEPPGIYDIPHFDFHFYSITKDARDAIVPTDPEFITKAARFPAADLVPAGFMVLPPTPAPVPAVPRMGVHWSNLAAPELQPPGSPTRAAFTQTFIFGSWNGDFIFAEPMITRDYLLTKPNVTIPIAPAARYIAGTYAPTAYRITYDAARREYRIALSGLTKR